MSLQRTSVARPSDLLELVGQPLGVSETLSITQEEVNQFADITRDHQWIHVDVERAKDGPFGSTVVHGFLTLSMVSSLFADVLEVREFSMGVNYGLDRVRFVRPLPPGVPIRGTATLISAEPLEPTAANPAGGVQGKASVAVEFADESGVCCVAEILFRYYE